MPDIAIRTDAGLDIGTGHVMRCLTLASALRAQGHSVQFITRALRRHLAARIESEGFGVVLLPEPDAAYTPGAGDPAHSGWAGIGWKDDAEQVANALRGSTVDWLVLDHYAFDARWQRTLAPHARRIMVWDDLADRPHACDLLLDQNLGRNPDSYAGLVPAGAQVLAGPRYAVLRPEFALSRERALRDRRGRGLQRIQISMGGVDRENATGAVLEVLAGIPGLRGVTLEVILGSSAPWVENVRAQADSMPMQVDIAVDVHDMADRMARADLAIGAVGGTTWERCALGLPSLLLTIADNQHSAAQALDSTGAALLLGDLTDDNWRARLANVVRAPDLESRLAGMSKTTAELCAGDGAARVAAAMNELQGTCAE